MKHFFFVLTLAAFAVGIPAYAHHSFATYYIESKSVSIEGELVQFEYRSPHAWVHIMAKDDKGQLQKFSAEWANPNRLKQQNVTKDTFKPGDYVIITGSPGRNAADHVLHLKVIQRPVDGQKWGGGGRR